jgi:hypothetical protein
MGEIKVVAIKDGATIKDSEDKAIIKGIKDGVVDNREAIKDLVKVLVDKGVLIKDTMNMVKEIPKGITKGITKDMVKEISNTAKVIINGDRIIIRVGVNSKVRI